MSDPYKEGPYTSGGPRVENIIMTGGMLNNVAGNLYHGPREALQLLKQKVSPAAFHNSKERFDPPKCHANTRDAVLKKIMDWIMSRDLDTRDKLIMWLRGAAGAGKTAIAQTLAELCEENGLILASYFFSRFDSTRNHPQALIATIAYQIYTNIPSIQGHILGAIDNDPLIFERNLVSQLTVLIHQPLQKLLQVSTDPLSRRIIIIDGLDECNGESAQREIIGALFHALKRLGTPIISLVASRPELAITTAFHSEPSGVLGRIPLDNDYRNNEDIEHFLRDKFQQIKETHRLKHHLPATWPDNEAFKVLVYKSSGQFIYAATVIKYVESPRGRPDLRLQIIQGLRPPQNDKDMPFAELDKLYAHILLSVEELTLVLDILRFVINLRRLHVYNVSHLEYIFELEAGTIETFSGDLGGLIDVVDTLGFSDGTGHYSVRQVGSTKHRIETSQTIKILHASFQDFLDDPARSKEYYRNPTEVILDQLKRCFRFIMKCSSTTSTSTINERALVLAAEFFVDMHTNVRCDIELANILDGRSLGRLLRSPTLSRKMRYYYLRSFIPKLFHFLKLSDMIEVYLNFQMTLDDEYLCPMTEPYYRDPERSYLLVFLCMKNIRTIDFIVWAFSGLIDDDNYSLVLNCLSADSTHPHYVDPTRHFLQSPGRSRQYSLKTSGGRLYSNALLCCLDLLHKRHPNSYRTYPRTITSSLPQNLRSGYDQRDIMVLSRWTENGPESSQEDESGDSPDTRLHPFSYLESLQTLYEDDPSIHNVRHNLELRLPYVGELLQDALYCFPRAGRCDKLLHLCKTKSVPKHIMRLENEERLFHAMDAYAERWKDGGSGSPEADEWAYPLPLVKRKVSIFSDEEKDAILKLRSQSGM